MYVYEHNKIKLNLQKTWDDKKDKFEQTKKGYKPSFFGSKFQANKQTRPTHSEPRKVDPKEI